MSAGDRGHPIFAAFFDRMSRSVERRGMGRLRQELLRAARGTVVEIGAGTGLNFAHYPAEVTEVLATEPDPHMRKRCREAAARAPVPVRVEPAPAEALPFGDEMADTVVATLVLCSVADPAAALAEMHRVIRPSGSLLFLEHVRSDQPRVARWQDRIQPIWSFFGGGCHPNRDSVAAIQRAGFELEWVERFPFSPNMIVDKPHAQGAARKAG